MWDHIVTWRFSLHHFHDELALRQKWTVRPKFSQNVNFVFESQIIIPACKLNLYQCIPFLQYLNRIRLINNGSLLGYKNIQSLLLPCRPKVLPYRPKMSPPRWISSVVADMVTPWDDMVTSWADWVVTC